MLLRKGLDLPDPALQGRKRLKASSKKELDVEAQEIALKIMSSHKEAEAEVSEGKEKATGSKAEASEGKASASEGKQEATVSKAKLLEQGHKSFLNWLKLLEKKELLILFNELCERSDRAYELKEYVRIVKESQTLGTCSKCNFLTGCEHLQLRTCP